MGALTVKHKEFQFRSWEPKSFIALDSTEVSEVYMRIDKLKTKRIRILPLNYWISDKKRFNIEKELESTTLMCHRLNKWMLLSYHTLKENKKSTYVINKYKAYTKILNNISKKFIKIFLSKILTVNEYNKLHLITKEFKIYEDFFELKGNQMINNFDFTQKSVLLICNPRLESPLFNVYLMTKNLRVISLSSITTTFVKEQVPLTTCNLIECFQGKFDLTNIIVITSVFHPNFLPLVTNVMCFNLTPKYFQSQITFSSLSLHNESKELSLNSLNFNFSERAKLFGQFFLSSINNMITTFKIAIPLSTNLFDHFFTSKLNQKVFSRLFLLKILLIIPQKMLLVSKIYLAAKKMKVKKVKNKNYTIINKNGKNNK